MPSIVGEDKIKERFDNGGGEMEHIFREKFLQNLNVSFFSKCCNPLTKYNILKID